MCTHFRKFAEKKLTRKKDLRKNRLFKFVASYLE